MHSRSPSAKDQAIYLEDIVVSIDDIVSFLGQMTLAEYTADLKTRRAVERGLQIITEAGIRLGNEAIHLCPTIDWRSLRSFGNFLRHSYDTVDAKIVWNTIQDDLPQLRGAAQAAIDLLNSKQNARAGDSP